MILYMSIAILNRRQIGMQMRQPTEQPRGGRNQVMRALLDGPEQGRSMRQLEQFLGANRSTLFNTISWLMRHGWVTRGYADEDIEEEQGIFFYRPTAKGKNWTFKDTALPTISWGKQGAFRRAVLTMLTQSPNRFLTPNEIANQTGYDLSMIEKFFDWACGLRLTTGKPVKDQKGVYAYKFTPKGAQLAEAYLKAEHTS